MEDGGKDLDAAAVAFVKQVDVKAQALLIGDRVVSVGIDAGPVDGGAQHLDAQLVEQFQVLPPAVVEVDAVAERVVGLVLGVGQRLAEFGVAHPAVGLGGPLSFGPGRVEVAQVLGVQPFAALIVSAVRLGGSHGAAPQKIL